MSPNQLDDLYAYITGGMPGTSGVNLSDSEEEISPNESSIDNASASSPEKPVTEVLDELAAKINASGLTKFNIARNFIWEGAKRAVSRKSFSSANKVSVKFTDDNGNSEGAVDQGGPMREFFTLILQYIHDSNLLCGPVNSKFLSYNAQHLEENNYYIAGLLIAMSLVHGGPPPHFFSPIMFEALINDQPLSVPLQYVYDQELQSSLEVLRDTDTVVKARGAMVGNLATVMDLAGTLAMPIYTLSDVSKIIDSTAHWFVLGRCKPALESFRQGLSSLGVLEAVKKYPNSFKPLFCDKPENLTADKIEKLFRVEMSPVGSSKALTESLVLSRWGDYLQEVEDGDESDITLSDILFFTTGCRELLQRGICPTIEFLHGQESWGSASKYPTANTCSGILRIPVVHSTYEDFKANMTFGILNGKGFGCA